MRERGGQDWTRSEVDLAVADYFAMLNRQLRGDRYSKTEHRRRLNQSIPACSDGSIEFKHQNISAVLVRIKALVGFDSHRRTRIDPKGRAFVGPHLAIPAHHFWKCRAGGFTL